MKSSSACKRKRKENGKKKPQPGSFISGRHEVSPGVYKFMQLSAVKTVEPCYGGAYKNQGPQL